MATVSESKEGIATPQIFSKLEAEGECDGFLWPYEGGGLGRFCWDDGEEAVKYETCKGTLYLRRGKFRHYGFEEDGGFARASRRGALTAEKPRGILTIGALRAFPPSTKSVYMIVPDCPVKLRFPVTGPEEGSIVTEILAKRFPYSQIFTGGDFLGGIHFPSPSFWASFRRAMEGPHKRDLLFLMFVGVCSVALTLYGLADRLGFVGGGCVALLFVFLVGRLGLKIERANT